MSKRREVGKFATASRPFPPQRPRFKVVIKPKAGPLKDTRQLKVTTW